MTDHLLDPVVSDDPGQLPAPELRESEAIPVTSISPAAAEIFIPDALLSPVTLDQPPPLDGQPAAIKSWFDGAVLAAVPDHDGTLETAHAAAQAYARHAKAQSTHRAYWAEVRAWCDWCHRHTLPCLPADPADVVAFLAAERGSGLSVTTVELRRAAIRYLHFVAACPVPTAEARVAETVSGMRRHAADRGDLSAKKLAATADLLRDILWVIPITWLGCATGRCCCWALPGRYAGPSWPQCRWSTSSLANGAYA